MKINEIITDWMIMPQTIKPLGLIRKPGGGFDFRNHSNNRANENKIRLSTDPHDFGAYGTDTYKATGPITNIPVNQLVGFEPEDKMRSPKSMAKVNAIANAIKNKQSIPPVLARKYKNGYQVIDGHHRFWGSRKAGVNFVKAQIVPPEDIEEVAGVGIVTKQNATKDVPVGGEYNNVKKLHLSK